MVKSYTCYSCSREVEFNEGELTCDVLLGWLMVSCLKGVGSIDRYSFCSYGCLKVWVDTQLPAVPDIFLKSLGEESND